MAFYSFSNPNPVFYITPHRITRATKNYFGLSWSDQPFGPNYNRKFGLPKNNRVIIIIEGLVKVVSLHTVLMGDK